MRTPIIWSYTKHAYVQKKYIDFVCVIHFSKNQVIYVHNSSLR